MEKLNIKCERKSTKELLFESNDAYTCINWLITALYDNAVKRAKVKVQQYYKDRIEYCKIIAKYNDNVKENDFIIYTISGLRNEWGNFVNFTKTLQDNNIDFIQK